MEQSKDNIIEEFEILLNQKCSKQTSRLYANNAIQKNTKNTSYCPFRARDVISQVSKQLKAMQMADTRSYKQAGNRLDKYKKLELIPYHNMLPEQKEVHTAATKFETQCISDTQLINVVENAEILDRHTDTVLRKEFSNTLSEESKFNIIDTDNEVDKESDVDITLNCHCEDNNKLDIISQNGDNGNTEFKKNIQISDSQSCGEKAICLSPILHVPVIRKFRTPPLVFNLETFEKFENIALPIIEGHDLQIAKTLINSKLLSKEDILDQNNISADILCSVFESKEGCSVINEQSVNMDTSIKQEFQVPEDVEAAILEIHSKDINTIGTPMKTEFKDEILFSSDEEDEYLHKEIQELPLTCALETSFYDQSEVLDKTMYVGFQTASNKSIQISTGSFIKAKSILSDIENKSEEEPTFTELVEICDSLKTMEEIDGNLKDVNFNKMDTDESNEECSKLNKVLKDCNVEQEKLSKNNADIMNDDDTIISQVLQFPRINQNDKKTLNSKHLMNTKEKRKKEELKNGSNKKIKIEESLEYSMEIFEDTEFNKSLKNDCVKAECKLNDVKCEMDSKNIFNDPKRNVLQIHDHILLQEFEHNEISLEVHKNKDLPSKISFKTASNKNIAVSDEAVKKCNNLFQDILAVEKDFSNCENNFQEKDMPKMQNITGFKTASNKQIMISNDFLQKTKCIFQDIDVENIADHTTNIKSMSENFANKPISNKFVGFKTAANNDIIISDQAMAKTKNFYKDIDKGFNDKINNSVELMEEEYINENDLILIEEMEKSESFLTNSVCKDRQKSDESSKTAINKIMTKTENDVDMDNTLFKQNNNNKEQIFMGFATANNKPIKISEKALRKCQNIFDGIDDNNCPKLLNYTQQHIVTDKEVVDTKNNNNSSENHNAKSSSLFAGFKTASNKEVKISEHALVKSRKLLENMEVDDNYSNNVGVRSEHDSVYTGFKTASNKNVKISEEALKKSKKLFEINEPSYYKNNDVCSPAYKGFQTASNKQIHISDKALAKTKFILEEFNAMLGKGNLEPNEGFQIITNQTTSNDANVTNNLKIEQDKHEFKMLPGFQTANNKFIKISDESLAKSKAIFQNIDNDSDINKTHKTYQGFQTASNKKVDISEHSLARSKKLLDSFDEKNILSKDTFKGFQTASNKKVTISNKALAKTKHMFDNLDIEIEPFAGFDNITADVENSQKLLATGKELFKKMEANIVQSDIANPNRTNETSVRQIKENIKEIKSSKEIKECDILDTQVMNNFEETLYTEDFCNDTPKSKRSGSPILSCPRAKKKKFETPYRSEKKAEIVNKPFVKPKPAHTLKFNDSYKKSKLFNLDDIQKMEKGIKRIAKEETTILDLNFDNLLQFQFVNVRNDVTGDSLSVDKLKNIFLDSVNKKIVPEGWMDNHLKLIIWKLISYEIKFPNCMKNVCSAKNVLDQLKYRYDKELYNVERPAFRKILEKDDVSTKPMVLCVVGTYEDNISISSMTKLTNNIELLLTDGWYCIKACIDRMLCQFVFDKKIVIGTKIVTCGAELLNCEQGIAPWEDTSQVRLKIFGNCTRRAPWLSRLGFCATPIMSNLSAVNVNGGKVPRVRVLVTRVYPALYVEKLEDGSTVTLSERLEHMQQVKYEADRQALMEKVYEELEKELEDQDSQYSESYSGEKRNNLDSGSQIAKYIKKCKDPDEYRSHLTHTQNNLLEEHVSRQREKQLQEIRTKVQQKLDKFGLKSERNVIPLLKVRVADFTEKDGRIQVTKGFLSIWKPSDAVLDIVKEGAWIEILNVMPTGTRNAEIQLSAGRQTIFNQCKHKETAKLLPFINLLKRTCLEIKTLSQNPLMSTDYNEVDTTGVVFLIEPTTEEFEGNKNSNFQNVYLADADKNIICINFWGGIKKCGFQNMLQTGQIVACINLQKRAGNTRKSIPQYRATEFSYFTKTPKNEQALKVMNDLSKKIRSLDIRRFCEDCAVLKNNYVVIKASNNENVSPYRFNNSDYNLAKNKLYIESPLNKCDQNLNLTGLDFESTFKQETQDLSPLALQRKKRVNEKIAKLKIYGEPPPLSNYHIINQSKNASDAYKSPLLIKSDVSNVVNVRNIPPEESPKTSGVESPLLNKTYVKRNVNPVKLNFSNVNDNESDLFAEDFDASPPLSLDSDVI